MTKLGLMPRMVAQTDTLRANLSLKVCPTASPVVNVKYLTALNLPGKWNKSPDLPDLSFTPVTGGW